MQRPPSSPESVVPHGWEPSPSSRYAGAGACPGCGHSSVAIYYNAARGAHFFAAHIPGGALNGARCTHSSVQCSFADLRASTLRGAWDAPLYGGRAPSTIREALGRPADEACPRCQGPNDHGDERVTELERKRAK